MMKTTEQYRKVYQFYADVFQNNLGLLSESQWLLVAESLTHRTKNNLHPMIPLDHVAFKFPSGFRRCAISGAFGQTKSTKTRFDKWQAKKNAHEEKNTERVSMGKKAIEFCDHPPKWGEENQCWLSYYQTEWKLLDEHHVLLKLYNGKTYVKRKIALQRPLVLLYKNNKIGSVQARVAKKEFKMVSVDLGMKHHAVITLQDADGRVLKTKFISAKEDNHRRKLYLSAISRKQKQTGIIPEGETFAKMLWEKVRNFNDDVVHRVSKQIVMFAYENGANTIVFEHLGNL
jgi:putative transposase